MSPDRPARPRPPHQQHERQQKQKDDSQQPEHVNERNHRRLLLHHPGDGGIRALRGRRRIGAGRKVALPRRLDRVLRRGRVGIDVRAEDVEVLLLFPREQRSRRRDADASAEVAHQIEEAGGVPHPLAWNRIHADRRQRHEQRGECQPLEELRPEDVPVSGVKVQLAEPEERERPTDQPARDHLAWIDPADQHADRRHPDERSHPSRRHRDPRLQRRIAEQRLQHDWKEHEAPVQHEPERRHQKHAGGVAPDFEHTQIDDRLARHPLAHQERDEAAAGDDRERVDELRLEPVVLLAEVEHELQRADPHAQKADSPVVDPLGLAPQVRRIEHVELRHHQRSDTDRQVDVEHPPPAVCIGQPPTEHRAEDWRDDDAEAPEAHGTPAVLWWEGFEEDCLRKRLHRAACRTLDQSKSDQQRQVGCEAAKQRRDRESDDRCHQQALAPEVGREPSGQRQDDGIGHEVRSQHPCRFVDRRREVAGDVRQRHVDDRRVEDLHEGREHDRNGHDPRIDVRVLRRHRPISCRPSGKPTCLAGGDDPDPGQGRGRSSPAPAARP